MSARRPDETPPHDSKTNVESCIRGDGCHTHWLHHQISSKDPDDAHYWLQGHPRSPCLTQFGGIPACHTPIIQGINPLASEESGSQTQSTDSMTMSIKEMKEELMCLGGNAKGCVERPDMQARLLEARAELLELRAAPAMQVPEFYHELHPAAAATTPPPLPNTLKSQQQTLKVFLTSLAQLFPRSSRRRRPRPLLRTHHAQPCQVHGLSLCEAPSPLPYPHHRTAFFGVWVKALAWRLPSACLLFLWCQKISLPQPKLPHCILWLQLWLQLRYVSN